MLKTVSFLTVLMVALLAAYLSSACSTTHEEQAASVGLSNGSHSQIAGAMAADDDDDAADDDDADDDEGEEDGEEVVIALDQVPQRVLEAAKAAVPGAVFSSAEMEQEHGQLVYCLEGLLGDERVEVEVAADGEVLEIERG